MDLNQVNEWYRKKYSESKSDAKPPKGHIDDVSTFFIEVSHVEVDLYESFSGGLSPAKTGALLSYIHDNLPTDNLKIIISLNGLLEKMCAMIVDKGNVRVAGLSGFFNHVENPPSHRLAFSLAILKKLCDRLSQDNTYLGVQQISCFNPRTGKDYPLEVTYISKDKNPKLISPLSENHIEWKHSWKVSGHWRKVKGMGKNRYNERVVFGKTWVIPTIKGNGILIEKTKVVNL